MYQTIKRSIVWLLIAVFTFSVFLNTGRNDNTLSPLVIGQPSADSVEAVSENVEISSRFLELLFGKDKNNKEKELLLIPGGGVFGAKIKQEYVTISDPGENSSLKAGDRLISINGGDISSINDVKKIASELKSETVKLTVMRGGKKINCEIQPKLTDGEIRLGITLKDGAAGIGTITYIDPETGMFGGLGHGICDSDTGEVIEMTEGDVMGVILGGVKKGEVGKPGELSGILTEKRSGVLYSNTECGVFGKLDKIPENADTVSVKVGHKEDVHTGEATIISTVKTGHTRQFKIEITEITAASSTTKSFKIKVTDPALTAITGGVVRGMSGSPIIQDGKLIGAVTHVMVNEPTEGYGIFIENMLDAAARSIGDGIQNAA